MRIMIKGGVWKNTEDEILKAAVMKYGKNQWARISSLLVRKSAKQCKARWYEWLDPSIKKTEWTREEDEKLLHLAKLMPTQWRTIAPIVGRTPSQCLERYEKLLDAACAKDENYEANDDPRKLRPGEIDPNPESKPARPDPVDMDEDEKEMLSEARARLANTRGKKAKRKAREKQLEEARRLASLQKRRELKAAGIDTRQRKRKRKGIDYNAEIPFEKRPPPGFYDTIGEDRPLEHVQFPTTMRSLKRQDAPAAIIQANKLNDPEAVTKRSKLMLPPPQISDHELEEIAKMGNAGDPSLTEELGEGSTATRALLTSYSQTPRLGMTPLRTPQRTPAGKGDAIMMEAENLARLRESQTPLLGGENPELHHQISLVLHHPKNEYQIVMPPITEEEREEAEEKIEEDMSDKLARERAEEQAGRRPCSERDPKSRSTFVPPTSLEQADELINDELLKLLEHDNAKYPLDEKTQKDKKKGSKRQANGAPSIPEIEDFDEGELKEAGSMLEEEVQYLRVAMGHESGSFEDFVKAHDACQEDLMFFPNNNSYGLASVAGNADKIAALQYEFEIVKKRMDDEAKKASRLEQKIKLLTQGYQVRAGKLWSQVQDTFKQMDTSATELECFQELQKQEQMAASYRIRNLTEEVNKQKALEQTLQSRYGDLLSNYQRIQEQLEEQKKRRMIQEEMEAQKRAQAEEIEAQNRVAQEEKERVNRSAEEEVGQMGRTADEVAGSKQANEDQMDVDNNNVDGEFIGLAPPGSDTQGDENVVSVEQNSSAKSGDNATTDDGASSMIDDASELDHDHIDSKNKLPTVGANLDEGSDGVSSAQAVSTEANATVPE
ncbi:hypothetical protein GUJ93_ZPchr0061g33658 [Zizania palustris]|uniref:Cell division cycle 5-like protein n=1 Tax=Zizania palustris TaxID=103762 RepID=A0A8J5REV2_ZIZPA|nr:hypothetical protein GUJ93_ZPchr0061g33658 [Zizania palustris]